MSERPPCKAANCLRTSWSRGLCQPCYVAANKRREQLQDGGLTRDVAWRRAIDELAASTPLPPIQILDPKREQDYLDLVEETVEVCDALGIDRTADYDLARVAREVVAERDRLRAIVTATAEAIGDLGNATGARTLPEAVAGLARLWLAADRELDELRANLEERRRQVETIGQPSPGWRAQFEAEEKRHAETFARLTTEAGKVQELTDLVSTLEAKLSAADADNAKFSTRIEWSESRLNLDVVAGEYRFTLASIFPVGAPYAKLYAFPKEGEEQKIHGRDLADVVAIVTALLSLRGITVPPHPATVVDDGGKE